MAMAPRMGMSIMDRRHMLEIVSPIWKGRKNPLSDINVMWEWQEFFGELGTTRLLQSAIVELKHPPSEF